jgi:hypothetical protein
MQMRAQGSSVQAGAWCRGRGWALWLTLVLLAGRFERLESERLTSDCAPAAALPAALHQRRSRFVRAGTPTVASPQSPRAERLYAGTPAFAAIGARRCPSCWVLVRCCRTSTHMAVHYCHRTMYLGRLLMFPDSVFH